MMNPTMGYLSDVRTLIAGLEWPAKHDPDANISINPMERDAILAALRALSEATSKAEKLEQRARDESERIRSYIQREEDLRADRVVWAERAARSADYAEALSAVLAETRNGLLLRSEGWAKTIIDRIDAALAKNPMGVGVEGHAGQVACASPGAELGPKSCTTKTGAGVESGTPAHSVPEIDPVPDKGPWTAQIDRPQDRSPGWEVYSEDFTHDVTLTIHGDFASDDEKRAYAKWLAATLNTHARWRAALQRGDVISPSQGSDR